MTATVTRPMPATARPCPAWCNPAHHIVEADGSVLHCCSVGIWDVCLFDHQLEDGSRGWGEAVVDTNLSWFSTAATAREIAGWLEEVAVLLEGMEHTTTVFHKIDETAEWPWA